MSDEPEGFKSFEESKLFTEEDYRALRKRYEALTDEQRRRLMEGEWVSPAEEIGPDLRIASLSFDAIDTYARIRYGGETIDLSQMGLNGTIVQQMLGIAVRRDHNTIQAHLHNGFQIFWIDESHRHYEMTLHILGFQPKDIPLIRSPGKLFSLSHSTYIVVPGNMQGSVLCREVHQRGLRTIRIYWP